MVKLLTAAALGLQLLGGGPTPAEAATKPKSAKAEAARQPVTQAPAPAPAAPQDAEVKDHAAKDAAKPPALNIPEEPRRQPADAQAVRQKEEDLARREQALRELEKDLDARLRKLSEMEANLKQLLETADARKDERFKHLVDVYANMKAKQAAAALEQLQEPIAVKILSGMAGRQAGEIMSNMSAEKAAVLSEALTRNHAPLAN